MSVGVAKLEWRYEPVDLLNEPITVEFGRVNLRIEAGVAIAEVDADLFELSPNLTLSIANRIRAQLLPHVMRKATGLVLDNQPQLVVTRPDGSSELYLEGTAIVSITDTLHVQIIENGTVTFDSEQAARDEDSELADLLSESADDALLQKLMNSYFTAMRDKANELIHLYEISEALKVRFGGKRKEKDVADVLGVAYSKLQKLFMLCHAPSKTSRHRGAETGPLRELSSSEVYEARDICRSLIRAYALRLKAQG